MDDAEGWHALMDFHGNSGFGHIIFFQFYIIQKSLLAMPVQSTLPKGSVYFLYRKNGSFLPFVQNVQIVPNCTFCTAHFLTISDAENASFMATHPSASGAIISASWSILAMPFSYDGLA
jgi:hypothetical protein